MLKVIIADDHELLRTGIRQVLSQDSTIEVVGEARDGTELMSLINTVATDVLVLDVSMPGPGFLELLRRIKATRPNVKILVLSMYPESLYAVRAMRAGAAGYLTKLQTSDNLVPALHQIHSGRRYVTQELAEQLVDELVNPDGASSLHEKLSDREFEVMRALGAGQGVNAIAVAMHLSPKTVSTYRTRVLQKLGFKGNSDIIRYVIENHIEV